MGKKGMKDDASLKKTSGEDDLSYQKMTTQLSRRTLEELQSLRKSADSSSVLLMLYGEDIGRRFEVKDEGPEVTIGRDPRNQISLEDTTVSRMHCRLRPGAGTVDLEDSGSRNHTYANGDRTQSLRLRDGDQVRVGRTIFKFLTGDNIESAYHEEIHRLMSTDSLTSAHNRKYFDQELERMFSLARRYDRPLSLCMLDIDLFKQVNDRHGHLFGDRVLAQLGAIAISTTRSSDVFCRYGGEEFALLLPETSLPDAVENAERLRREVCEAQFSFDGTTHPITVSVGVAEVEPSMKNAKELIEVADQRLYVAKDHGRNRGEPTVPSS